MNVRKSGKRTAHNGSTFDSFLEEEGIHEKVEAVAIKRVHTWQIEQAL
jgi:antitoxin HicB